jgi:uncharacterized protein
MIRIVADTNIYISAILFGGKPEKIMYLAASEKLILIVSNAILTEIASVLRNKFNWSNHQVSYTDLYIREISLLVTPSHHINLIQADETDNRILECALEGQADYIVSGDQKHLLPLKYFHDIPILNASSFLKRLS